jgi:hypothetical protein
MSSWDDAEVDSDGDELLDWLWDIPDRYDVGIDDAEVDEPGSTRRFRSRPADVVDPFNGFAQDQDEDFASGAVPLLAYAGRTRSRITARDAVAVAGVVLVIAGGAGIGYRVFAPKGSTPAKQSNLAVGTPSTAPATSFDPTFGAAPGDTTTSVPPTTEAATTSSLPGAIAAVTSTTAVKRTTTTPPTAPPTTPTTVPPTTTSTEPPSTTTSSTVPDSTTSSTFQSGRTTTTASSLP